MASFGTPSLCSKLLLTPLCFLKGSRTFRLPFPRQAVGVGINGFGRIGRQVARIAMKAWRSAVVALVWHTNVTTDSKPFREMIFALSHHPDACLPKERTSRSCSRREIPHVNGFDWESRSPSMTTNTRSSFWGVESSSSLATMMAFQIAVCHRPKSHEDESTAHGVPRPLSAGPQNPKPPKS